MMLVDITAVVYFVARLYTSPSRAKPGFITRYPAMRTAGPDRHDTIILPPYVSWDSSGRDTPTHAS